MTIDPIKKQHSNRLLVVTTCMLLLLGFTVSSLINYYLANQSIQTHIRNDNLPLTSDNIYSHVQRDLIRPVLISSVMAKDTFVRDWIVSGEQDASQIINYLREIQTEYQTITSFFISDASHRYYHSTGILKTVEANNSQDAWYFASINMDGHYDINLDTDTADPTRTTFFVNHKVYDYSDRLLGIVGVGLASEIIRERIDLYQQQFSRTVYFLNKQGDVTLHGTNFSKAKSIHEMKGMQAISKQLAQGLTGSYVYENPEHQVFVNTRFVDELDWYIVVEEANIEETEILRALYGNLTLGILLTLIIGWLIHHLVKEHQTQLHMLLTRDFLTDLATRQGFEPVFQQMLKTAKRSKAPLSLLVVDLDHFKAINDRMGHLEGDTVLKEVARILEDSVRECDALARWGGEEFVIALANCDINAAYQIAEKIRKRIASDIQVDHENSQPTTTSIGLATFDPNESADSLFARADEALYRAKEAGRNRVCKAT